MIASGELSMAYLSQYRDNSLVLRLYIQPKSSRNRLVGPHNDALKLCITAPPVDNQANRAIIAFLAKLFKIPKSGITIQSGQQGRNKVVILEGLPLAEAEKRLQECLDQ